MKGLTNLGQSFLTPKPAVLPPVPLHRLVLISIVGSATLCFLIHTLSDPPSAGEASGGYLHGGILIDFIGQGKRSIHYIRFLVEDKRIGLTIF